MLSRPLINESIILRYNPLAHESYAEQYAKENDFKDVYMALIHGNQQLDYHMHENLLYHLGNICIPRDERENVIKEAHTSLIYGHFWVGKIVAQLQRYCYCPQMNETIFKYVKGCVMCATSKPSNINLGLYTQLLVPSHPWESISMDFIWGLSMSRTSNDYLYVIVDRFTNMCVLLPCKKHVTI
jgi:hypothetical protein